MPFLIIWLLILFKISLQLFWSLLYPIIATHSSVLAQDIPWTEEPDGLQSMGLQELDMTQQLNHIKDLQSNYLVLKPLEIIALYVFGPHQLDTQISLFHFTCIFWESLLKILDSVLVYNQMLDVYIVSKSNIENKINLEKSNFYSSPFHSLFSFPTGK